MMGPVDQSISAGLGGFFALFLLASALWLLMRSLLRHLRNVEHHTYPGDLADDRERADGSSAARSRRVRQHLVRARPARSTTPTDASSARAESDATDA